MGDEQIAARRPGERHRRLEALLGSAPPREGLHREPAVDRRPPLEPDATRLDAGLSFGDALPLEDDDLGPRARSSSAIASPTTPAPTTRASAEERGTVIRRGTVVPTGSSSQARNVASNSAADVQSLVLKAAGGFGMIPAVRPRPASRHPEGGSA